MTATEFREWMQRMGYTQAQAASALGRSVGWVNSAATGRRPIKRYVGLACCNLEIKAGGKPVSTLRAPPPPWAMNDMAAVEARLAAAEAKIEDINSQLGDLWLIAGILLKRIPTKGQIG